MHVKRVFFIVGILLLMLSGPVRGADLYRLDIPPGYDLKRIAEIPLEYFGRVKNVAADYALVSLAYREAAKLARAGLILQKLAPIDTDKSFYWLYAPPNQPLAVSLLAGALAGDGEGILMPMGPEEAERWSADGFALRLLQPLPPAVLTGPVRESKRIVAGAAAGVSPLIQEMMDRVTETWVQTRTGDLTGLWPVRIGAEDYTLATRNTYRTESIEKAARYLFEFYSQLGLEVFFEEFIYRDTLQRNVVAEKKGSLFPERIIALTAHYDDNPYSIPAPGADDNASGTVGVMAAAEVLSRYDIGLTLRFVHFAAEEQGMVGSYHHARNAFCRGDELEAAVNLDMIAWNTPGSPPDMEIHGNSTIPYSLELAALLQDVIIQYGLGLTAVVVPNGTGRSDQASFWGFRIPALLAIESLKDFNPNYHSAKDNLGNLGNLNFYIEMVKAGVALAAVLGEPVEEGWGYVEGTVRETSSGNPLPGVAVTIHNPARGYTFSTGSDEEGRYWKRVAAGDHQMTFKRNGYEPFAGKPINIPRNETVVQDAALLPGNFYSQVYFPLLTREWSPRKGCP